MQYQKVFLQVIFLVVAIIATDTLQAQRQRLRVDGREFNHQRRQRNQTPPPPPGAQFQHEVYRTYDGTMNNLRFNFEYGASDIELHRAMASEYGVDDPWNAMAEDNRPSARVVSNALSAQGAAEGNSFNLSSLVFSWGQFLDHDITLTPEDHLEYEPIEVPANDPTFTADINFFRSAIHDGTGVDNARQQTNLITSWIDASNVYGSDASRANWLRTFRDGKMKTSDGELLPYNTVTGEKVDAIDPDAPSMAGDQNGTAKTFVAGDIRAAEQPGLTSLHTIFVREHNRICEVLKSRGITDDEELYQLARKQVGAEMQAITYNEFLPALGIRLPRYDGYNDRIQPDISNMFATAAYRLGHTMVTDEILLIDDNCADVDAGSIGLLQGFFNTGVLETYGVEPILKGLSVQQQEEIDPKVVSNLRDFLFGRTTVGFDLAALNIQRGRDHGLPDFNSVRDEYTGRAARDFSEITQDAVVADALESTYQSIDDIDLWIGLLAEEPNRGDRLGPTLSAVLASQFENLRDGDFYYYENDPFLDIAQRASIRGSTLGLIINRNSNLSSMPTIAMFANPCGANGRSASNNEVLAETKIDFVAEVFPNPTTDAFRLKVDSESDEQIQIKLFDTNGKKLMDEQLVSTTREISLANYPNGVYVLKVMQGKENKTIRVVKTGL